MQTSETGEPQAKGYRRAHFTDAFDRYLTPANDASRQTGGPQASKRTSADRMGTTSDFCVRPEADLDGCKKHEKPANDGGLYAWTDKTPDGNEALNVEDFPRVCAHCGAPATADAPVQLCAVEGETFLLHRACQKDWMGETSPDLSIPPFLQRGRS